MKLWNKGFGQISKRLPYKLALKLCFKLYITKVNYEFSNKLNENKEFFEKLGFEFLPKTYNGYNKIKYYLDSSHGGVELEFKSKGYYSDIYNMIKFIEVFKLLMLGIITIEPFSLKTNRFSSYISLEYKNYYEINNLSNLVKYFLLHTK